MKFFYLKYSQTDEKISWESEAFPAAGQGFSGLPASISVRNRLSRAGTLRCTLQPCNRPL